jgi:hypothetical protein
MKTWLILVTIYTCFFFWYTDMGGKLSEDETQDFLIKYDQNLRNVGMSSSSDDGFYISSELRKDFLRKFMEQDTGRQFIMVNSIEMNKNPEDVAGANSGESAEQLMSRYMEHMWPNLLKRASHPIFGGYAIWESMDLVGIEGAETWDQAALMRYKSRRAFMEIVTHPEMRDRHAFKIAALQKTIAFPVEPIGYYSDLRVILGMLILIIGLSLQLFFVSRR